MPLLMLACFGFYLLAKTVTIRYPAAWRLTLFPILLAFALLLPAILRMMPEWLIPTRWSDFSFWSSLQKQASGSLREFLRAAPQSRDVELRLLLIKQAGIMFIAACTSIAVCCRCPIKTLRCLDRFGKMGKNGGGEHAAV